MKTKSKLKLLFPHHRIEEEYYVKYRGKKYFFDFYIPELGLVIECQGQQHYRFIEYFHGDIGGFINQKRRDRFKEEYCEENNLALVYVSSNKDVSCLAYLIVEALKKIDDNNDLLEWNKWIKR